MAGVVPQQVVGPRARLAGRVHVLAAKEVGLDVHLLHVQLTRLDPLVDPLVAGVEAAHVPGHADHAGLLLDRYQPLGIGDRISDWDLDQDVLAGAHGHLGLIGVDLGRTGDDHRLEARLLKRFGQVGRPVRNLPLAGELLGARRRPPVSEMTSMSGMFWIARMCWVPKAPFPAIAIFISFRQLLSLPASAVCKCWAQAWAAVSRVRSTTIVEGPAAHPVAVLFMH